MSLAVNVDYVSLDWIVRWVKLAKEIPVIGKSVKSNCQINSKE
jgi:hypothetical protein